MEIRKNDFGSRGWRALGGLLAALACVLPAQAQLGPPVSINDGGSYNITTPFNNGSADAYIGISNPNNSLNITGAGWLYGVNFGYIGAAAGSTNNTVTVAGGGMWDLGLLFLGDTGAFNNLTIASGGHVSSTSGGYVGNNAGANNNSIHVTGSSSLLDNNNNNLFIGNVGSANSMIIDSSAQVLSGDGGFGGGAGGLGVDVASINNSVVVTGSGSIWNNNGDLYIGASGSSNRLTIASGGLVISTNGLIGADGSSGGGNSNLVVVTDANSVWSNASSVVLGDMNGANSNNLVIANGGRVISDVVLIGSSAGSSNNAVWVTGNGSLWTNSSDFFVGGYGSHNALAITSSGRVMNASGYIGWGLGANNNLVLVSDSSVWTNSGALYVGNYSSYNSLIITNASQVFNNAGHVGYDTNATFNTAVVSGTNSIWNNNGEFHVGTFGYGNSLTIANSGQVIALLGSYIGRMDAAGSNSVLVTGAGSVWTNGGDLQVGGAGYGNRLAIVNGGVVANSMGFIGYALSASNNSAMVSDNSSVWYNTNGFAVGYLGSYNSLVITNGGVVLNATTGGVGIIFGADYNRALISGNGSTWSNGVGFAVGYFGSANQLAINNGGRLMSGDSSIGGDAGATNNTVLVTGSGSLWNATGGSGYLGIGDHGSGNGLVIANSGQVWNAIGDIGNEASASNNWVVVTGSGSLWSNSDHVAVGYAGVGNQLIITNGGTVIVRDVGLVGYIAGSTNNSILVTGDGSFWTNSTSLYIGGSGAFNRLTIANSGVVVNSGGYVGYSTAASNNSALVTDSGSIWGNTSSLAVGYAGLGNQLIITNGGTVVVLGNAYVGNTAGSTNNAVLVAGTDSLWTNNGNLYVGATGSFNQLMVANTGVVVNSMGFIGYDAASSNNRAMVNGNGSIWGNTNGFAVGYGGTFNSLLITNGGVVINVTTGGVGILPGANYNTVLISGGGSVWSNGSGFAMGLFGVSNRLTINNGGWLVTVDASIGDNFGANSNVVIVTDPGSVWSNRGDLNIGYATIGNQLVITNGGVVRTLGNVSIGTNASLLNIATLYIGGDFQNAATNQAVNNFSGTNVFNGASVLQNLEVASAFAAPGLGAATNFYFGTVSVGDAASGSNAWVRLVDNQVNHAGVGVETFGASNVIVALAQSILDLNNRTSFIGNLSNVGTILQTNAGPPGLVTRLDVVNTFTNAGTVLIGNGSVLQFSNAFVNNSMVQLLTGGVLTNFVTGGVLTNSASGTIFGDGLIAALIRNDGAITATGGTLRLSAGFAGDASGSPVNAGVLRAIGAGSSLQVAQSFTNSSTGIIAITNASFSGIGLVNQGIVRVDNQSAATFNGSVTNAFGATIRASNQSLLQFNGSLTNQGTLALVNPSTAIITGTLLLGPTGVLTMSATSSVMMLRSSFINGSTNSADYDTRYGTIFFGGSTPLTGAGAATNLFEVAGTNRGPSALGFNHNFAVGTLNITNHVQFVNNIVNSGGLGTNEALYVDVLHLFSGATIKLSQLTVYVGMNFVDDAVNQTFNGDTINEGNVHSYHGYDLSGHIFLDSGGQIVFVPEPSTSVLLLAGAGVAGCFRRRTRRCQDTMLL